MYISIQLCILVHGSYIGLKSNFIVWVLKEMELVAEDGADLSRKPYSMNNWKIDQMTCVVLRQMERTA